jgi:hypothetical protein
MNELKDWRGHVITVGTPIAYWSKSSECLKEGIVTEIFPAQAHLVVQNVGGAHGPNSTPRPVLLSHFDRIVVLPRTNHEPSHG